MNRGAEKVKRTTAPVPRGICGVCEQTVKLSRHSGIVAVHPRPVGEADCEGGGKQPLKRVASRDRRRTVGPVAPAPDGAELVTRDQVAAICGVTIRTVTRWVGLGYLTRYEDSRGRVAYARVQAEAMNRFEPVE